MEKSKLYRQVKAKRKLRAIKIRLKQMVKQTSLGGKETSILKQQPCILLYQNLIGKTHPKTTISSVQFSHSVVSDSLRPHELQHARTPCPSPTPGVHSDSRPSSQ